MAAANMAKTLDQIGPIYYSRAHLGLHHAPASMQKQTTLLVDIKPEYMITLVHICLLPLLKSASFFQFKYAKTGTEYKIRPVLFI